MCWKRANNARIEAEMEISGSSCDTLTKNRKTKKKLEDGDKEKINAVQELWIG